MGFIADRKRDQEAASGVSRVRQAGYSELKHRVEIIRGGYK
jgi:hypothetical protein